MDSSTVQYAGFIVAALILIWATIEINRRFFRRRKTDARSINTWVHLDASQPDADAPEESQPSNDENTTDSSEQDMRTRARQNGHYSESKRAY
jgi:hypothetical protein